MAHSAQVFDRKISLLGLAIGAALSGCGGGRHDVAAPAAHLIAAQTHAVAEATADTAGVTLLPGGGELVNPEGAQVPAETRDTLATQAAPPVPNKHNPAATKLVWKSEFLSEVLDWPGQPWGWGQINRSYAADPQVKGKMLSVSIPAGTIDPATMTARGLPVGGTGFFSTILLPTGVVTFEETTTAWLTGFAGAENSTVGVDPSNAANTAAKVSRAADALANAGTMVSTRDGNTIAPIAFSTGHTAMTVRVWSPDAGIPVRLKVEDGTNGAKSVEAEATVTVAGGWQTLTFDFAHPVVGTPMLNLATTYNRATIFFNYGKTGAQAGARTYYFGDLNHAPVAAGTVPPAVLGSDLARLSYKVRFASDFDPARGGKLPGLCGGTCNGGGHIPNGFDGFSVRYLFEPAVKGSVYAYLPSSVDWGTKLGYLGIPFKAGVWQLLEQEVKLNTVGLADGYVKVWLDGVQVIDAELLVFRYTDDMKIDGVYFDVFYGGGDDSWKAPKDTHIDFAEFAVYTRPD